MQSNNKTTIKPCNQRYSYSFLIWNDTVLPALFPVVKEFKMSSILFKIMEFFTFCTNIGNTVKSVLYFYIYYLFARIDFTKLAQTLDLQLKSYTHSTNWANKAMQACLSQTFQFCRETKLLFNKNGFRQRQ